jgi:CIC family chloride channel protein
MAIVYIKSFYGVNSYFKRLRISRYVRPMLGACVVGAIALIFPEVMGTGYGWAQIMINGSLQQIPTFGLPIIAILIILPFAKIFATSFSIGSGGSGGVFAPGIEIGASIGLLLFMLFHVLLPTVATVAVPFVIIGMLAFFGAAGKAPIAVMIMVTEMTGSLQLLPGAMIAVMLSYFISGDHTIYTSQVNTRQNSPVHFGEYNLPILKEIILRKVKTIDISIKPGITVAIARKRMEKYGTASLPIVSDHKLYGVVHLSDLDKVKDLEKVGGIVRKGGTYLTPENTAYEAWDVMGASKTTWVPIVRNGKYIGVVTLENILKSYKEILIKPFSH